MQSCLHAGKRRAARLVLTAAAITCSFAPPAFAQSVIYVDADASGANDGSSWANAFVYLQDALAVAVSGDEVWIAEGFYRPDQGAGVEAGRIDTSFVVRDSIGLYGGFAGLESARDERDWNTHLTILSGDLLDNDDSDVSMGSESRQDNSRNVVHVKAGTGQIVLDGVSIRAGHATTPGRQEGGGLRVDRDGHALVRNAVFMNNFARRCGGAIGGGGTLVVNASMFEVNVAGGLSDECISGSGGAIGFEGYVDDPPDNRVVSIDSSTFRGNTGICGGALAVYPGPLVVRNSTFVENTAEYGGAACVRGVRPETPAVFVSVRMISNAAGVEGGGALTVDRSHVAFHNSLFLYNTVADSAQAPFGGGIFCYEVSSLQITTSTFYGNTAPIGSAVAGSRNCRIELSNTIIWDNESASGEAIGALGDEANGTIEWCILDEGVATGFVVGSMVSAGDPLFADPNGANELPGDEDDDFTLRPGSPAIDGGSNALLPVDTFDLDGDGDTSEVLPLDLNGAMRIVDGGGGSPVVDLGPLEFSDGSSSVDDAVPSTDCGISRYPVPTSDRVVFAGLPRAASLQVTVYDILGRKRAEAHARETTSEMESSWEFSTSDLSTGHYLVVFADGFHGRQCHVVIVKS